MRTQLKLAAFALLLSTLNPQLSTVFAQGSLTPPGAPAPTMKSLAQIEPRTALTSAGAVTISQPGSYYLTTNITVSSGHAVTINANGVTLDLNGFSISSTASSATGADILVNGLTDITVLNGHVRSGVTNNGSGTYTGSGFAYGIYNNGNPLANMRVSGVSVSGCLYSGIYLGEGDSTLAECCTVRTVGSYGIRAATVKSSLAEDCGNTAVYGGQVSDTRGESSGGTGLLAVTAQNCSGSSASSTGLNAAVALNCHGYSAAGSGLSASLAQNCYGQSDGNSHGLYAGYAANNCCGYSASGTGLYANANAHNCRGYGFGAGTGLSADLADACYGYSGAGTGLWADKANFCFGNSVIVPVGRKYNMP